MPVKQCILGLIERPVVGAPLRAMGRPTWRRPRLLGLINPFYVPGFVVERDGARYFARPGTYLGQDGLRHAVRFAPGAYEPEISYLARTLVRDGDIVLDIGANVGLHSVAFARLAGSGHVYAFEPVTEMAEQLSANCAFNGIDNVTVIGCALGDREESLAMEVNIAGDGLEGTSTLAGTVHVERHPENYETRQVQVRRLDDVMNALDIDGRIGFVKIDTEGFETLVIGGGLETLRRHRPAMIVEAHSRRLARHGKGFGWYLDTFPDHHICIIYAAGRANPYLRLTPLKADQPEIAVNLLLLPKHQPNRLFA